MSTNPRLRIAEIRADYVVYRAADIEEEEALDPDCRIKVSPQLFYAGTQGLELHKSGQIMSGLEKSRDLRNHPGNDVFRAADGEEDVAPDSDCRIKVHGVPLS